MPPLISYAQRFEDVHLMRCFGDQPKGFYVDVGAGHPVYDNVSFAFYLRGWSGITVEPNPRLARLCRAVRPRDRTHGLLLGAVPGEATLFMFRDFHGLSTMIESRARAVETETREVPEPIVVPVTTLAALCEAAAPSTIDFLKVDVEGAEGAVLAGGNWQRFRPRIVVVEAIVPLDLSQSWQGWEALLMAQDYDFVWSDDLNRYYVAREARHLAAYFATAPKWLDDVPQIGSFGPAASDATHPDHHLAAHLARAAMTRLPMLDQALLLDLATVDLGPTELARPARPEDLGAALTRVLGSVPDANDVAALGPVRDESLRDLYARIIGSDVFRAACGRISASYAW